MAVQAENVVHRFTELTGQAPRGVWFAPGRVNLIGEHTDYNDGFVMPFALGLGATLAASPRPDDRVRVDSLDLHETVELAELRPYDQVPATTGWAAYLAGVVWALRQAGHEVGGIDMVLASDVPIGAGLSSSAAIECAVVAACCDLFDLEITPVDRAKLARVAENAFVGAPTGLLDQAASTLCQRDHALFLDCRTLETRPVPLPLDAQGLEILVLDTHTPHSHVDGEYAERRATCEAAAAVLGVPALRDVDDLQAALEVLREPLQVKRVRHVVTEDTRVLEAVELGSQGRLRDLGPLLDASHASMRDDFEITVPAVDTLAAALEDGGAYGARMTGGGFGGCVIALIDSGRVDDAVELAKQRAAKGGFAQPEPFVALASEGAKRLK